MSIPWPVATLDPHRIDDATAAILAPALFDTLYTTDGSGAPAPSLAESLPKIVGSRVVVPLRSGLRSASGRSITAREVLRSLARSRAGGAGAWLADVVGERIESPLAISFASLDTSRLARALSSPLTAIVPPTFSPDRLDGTGPFRASARADALILVRNDLAANGPAFLDEIVVRPAPDLAASLSAFEGGVDDIGWLGSGLHEPRPGARSFDAGSCAWAVLRTGAAAVAWDSPGIAQRICDGIPSARLAYLALGSPGPSESDDGWGGAPCDLLVRDDAPWLRELARAVAASISRPSHEVTVRPIPAAELSARRASRTYGLALDVVRPLDLGPLGALLSLATADDPAGAIDLARHPPRTEAPPRVVCRTMRIGVLGDIRIEGGHAADLGFALGPAPGRIEFGAITRLRKISP
jgi:peptide/nickel transport system substrate-binding protein